MPYSYEQADANARAYSLACKQARQHRICLTDDSILNPLCVGTFGSLPIMSSGGTPPYEFAIVSGTIPTGMTFSSVGLIQGTPTTSGTFSFSVRVTDAIGSNQTKTFTLRVVQITTSATLPVASNGVFYSETLIANGITGTVIWGLTAGALPSGLSLSSDGNIYGTPVAVSGTYHFTVQILDGTGADCSKEFSISTTVALMAYWRFESFSGDDILDSTAHGFNLSGNSAFSAIVLGRVGNGLQLQGNVNLDLLSGDFTLLNNAGATGFTIAGWFKLAPPDNTGNGNIVNIMDWNIPNSNLSLEILNADLNLNINAEDFSSPTLTIPNPQDGGWHFYRIWYDFSVQKMFFSLDNAAPVSSPVIPFGSGIFSQMSFAYNSVFTVPTLRYLDETGVWKRVLTDEEADDLYNGGNGVTYPNVPF